MSWRIRLFWLSAALFSEAICDSSFLRSLVWCSTSFVSLSTSAESWFFSLTPRDLFWDVSGSDRDGYSTCLLSTSLIGSSALERGSVFVVCGLSGSLFVEGRWASCNCEAMRKSVGSPMTAGFASFSSFNAFISFSKASLSLASVCYSSWRYMSFSLIYWFFSSFSVFDLLISSRIKPFWLSAALLSDAIYDSSFLRSIASFSFFTTSFWFFARSFFKPRIC